MRYNMDRTPNESGEYDEWGFRIEYTGDPDIEFRKQIKSTALTWKQLEKLPTPRLLAYHKKYRNWRGVGQCDCCGEILNKDDRAVSQIANEYLDGIKELLDKRGHVNK